MTQDQVRLAKLIATVAHGAKGQKRADKTTPYIVHPARVAQLCAEWLGENLYKSNEEFNICQAAAWLHDVVEDTKLTTEDLIQLGLVYPVVHVVDLLTKKNRPDEPEDANYYQGIASHDLACIVKAADICANLEDVLKELQSGREKRRWKKYAASKRKDALPVYHTLPFLRSEIEKRLEAIEELEAVNA